MNSDEDYQGVFLPSENDLLGLARSPRELTSGKKQSIGDRNQAGDIDRKHYAIQRFIELGAEGRDAGYKILLVSGRDDDFRDHTIDWLVQYNVSYDVLLMRRAGDSRKDALVKFDIYKTSIEPLYDVRFVVDDRKQVVEMWRTKLGLVCLQCDEGDC